MAIQITGAGTELTIYEEIVATASCGQHAGVNGKDA